MFNGLLSSRLRKYILPLAFIYIISPLDLLPLFPADDLMVAAFALLTYFGTRGVNLTQRKPSHTEHADEDDDVITTSWSVIEEE